MNDDLTDAREGLLTREGEIVPLAPKVFDMLLVLVESGGHLIGKEDLMSRVWPDSFVEEANISRNIFTLRKALGDEYIETVPKRGYRFVAPVVPLSLGGGGPDSGRAFQVAHCRPGTARSGRRGRR